MCTRVEVAVLWGGYLSAYQRRYVLSTGRPRRSPDSESRSPCGLPFTGIRLFFIVRDQTVDDSRAHHPCFALRHFHYFSIPLEFYYIISLLSLRVYLLRVPCPLSRHAMSYFLRVKIW